MAPQEQQPSGNPAETGFQRLLRQAHERKTLQQQQASLVVEPVVPIKPSESLGKPAEIPAPQETSFQRLLRQAREKRDQAVPAEQSALSSKPVEISSMLRETDFSRDVRLKIAGEESELLWSQEKSIEGLFLLKIESLENAKGSLKIPKDTLLTIVGSKDFSVRSRKEVTVAGGEGAEIPMDELQDISRNSKLWIELKTKDFKMYEETLAQFEAIEAGKASFSDASLSSKIKLGISAQEAITLLKESLRIFGEQPEGAHPDASHPVGPLVPIGHRAPAEEQGTTGVKIIPVKEKKRFPGLFRRKEAFRVVDIEIGGENTGAKWTQSKDAKGKIEKGKFYLEAFDQEADLTGDMNIPKGTRLQIIMPNAAVIHITGGKDANLPKTTMQAISSVGGTIVFNTDDYEGWERESKDFSKDEGGVTIADFNASQPQERLTRDISREDALKFMAEFYSKRGMSRTPEQLKAPDDELIPIIRKGSLLKGVREMLRANEDMDVVRLGVTPEQLAGLIRRVEWLDVPGWRNELLKMNSRTKVEIQDSDHLSVTGSSTKLGGFDGGYDLSFIFRVKDGYLKMDSYGEIPFSGVYGRFIGDLRKELKNNPGKLDKAMRQTIEVYLQKQGIANRKVSGINIKNGLVVFDFAKESALIPPEQKPGQQPPARTDTQTETFDSATPTAKTEAELKAEAEETKFLTSLAGSELQGEGKKAELEDEIKKFRANLRELKYRLGKASDGKRAKVYDEVGAAVGSPDIIYLFPEEEKNWGWSSLARANKFLEGEIQKGEPKRKREKAEREVKVQKLIANCNELGYVFTYGEHLNNDLSISPLIIFSDENGQSPSFNEFGGDTGFFTIGYANEFLEQELKLSKEERGKQKEKARAEIKATIDEFNANIIAAGFSPHRLGSNSSGRSLIFLFDKEGKNVHPDKKDNDTWGFFHYREANDFLRQVIEERNKK